MSKPTKAQIEKAVKRLYRANREYDRACRSGEQPRMNIAGTAYTIAKINLFHLFNL